MDAPDTVSSPNMALLYFAALVANSIVRLGRMRRRARPAAGGLPIDRADLVLLALNALGTHGLPLVFVFTRRLAFANYELPSWAGFLGLPLVAAALALVWRAHADLGENWSVGLRLDDDHELVTDGLYAHVRHPLYAAQWLWAAAQPLLIQNWLAGWATLPAFAAFYFRRVGREEAVLLARFGDAYRDYMRRTGRLLPRRRPPAGAPAERTDGPGHGNGI